MRFYLAHSITTTPFDSLLKTDFHFEHLSLNLYTKNERLEINTMDALQAANLMWNSLVHITNFYDQQLYAEFYAESHISEEGSQVSWRLDDGGRSDQEESSKPI